MSNINWDTFKCRCSGISKILSTGRGNEPLTENQYAELATLQNRDKLTERMKENLAYLLLKRENSKKVVISDTAIDYLMDVYAWETQGMVPLSKELDVEQLQKGRLAEDDSILLLSAVEGEMYYKNEERVANDFLTGEPDIFKGDNIMNAIKITDIKTCFDYPSFLKKLNKPIGSGWTEQVQGYCDITGATEGEIAHCLVDMPEVMVNDWKRRLFHKMDVPTEENPQFKERWALLERSMKFQAIPPMQRVFKIKIEPFTEMEKRKVYDRVKFCREWLWEFDAMYNKINIETSIIST